MANKKIYFNVKFIDVKKQIHTRMFIISLRSKIHRQTTNINTASVSFDIIRPCFYNTTFIYR